MTIREANAIRIAYDQGILYVFASVMLLTVFMMTFLVIIQ